MVTPEPTQGSEEPPSRRRIWELPSRAAIIFILLGAVASITQIIDYALSGIISPLIFSVTIVVFIAIGGTYSYLAKRRIFVPVGIGVILTISLASLAVIKSVFPLQNSLIQNCHRIASPDGSDANTGSSLDSPVKTVGRLTTLLAPGQTGCLRGGTYTFNQVELMTERTHISSYPGEQATIIGHLIVGGAGSVIENLRLDGSSSGSDEAILVVGPDVKILGNEIVNSKERVGDNLAVCVRAGENSDRLAIERNRIHNCGRDPSDNNGFAIQIRYSNDALIKDNFIYDNADDAINLYPAAQHVLIANNTIDGNGAGITFAGAGDSDGTMVSSHNLVENNIITNSTLDWNIQEYWGSPGHVGIGNIARLNCLLGTNKDTFYNTNGGVKLGSFEVKDNIIADPQYVDQEGKDFRIIEGSPCAGKGASPS